MTLFFVYALAALSAFAKAAPLVRRCDVPGINQGVLQNIYNVALSMNVDETVMVSMICTAIQESNINNLDCGDKDSVGVFQQRPSQGWGSVGQIMDVAFATRSYLTRAIAIDAQNPHMDPGNLSQAVQNAEAGQLYSQHEAQAKQLLTSLGYYNGGAQKPAPSSTKPAPSSTTPAPPAASTPPSSGSGGAVNVGGAPPTGPPSSGTSGTSSIAGCAQTYRPVAGDTCNLVSSRFGISLMTFYNMNAAVDRVDCQNLQVGQDYCVKSGTSSTSGGSVNVGSTPANPAGGDPEDEEDDCVNLYTPVAGDTCNSVANAHGIPLAHFYDLNPCLDTIGCLNLEIGEQYCVDKPSSGASA